MGIISRLERLLRLTEKDDPLLTIRDVAYFSGSDAHVNHKLDIYLPALPKQTDQKHIPVVVHIHGGAWVHGSRSNRLQGGPLIGRTCARHGYVGVVVSYRLASTSLVSFLAWSFILGLIIFVVGLALASRLLISGYIALAITAYAYLFLYRVRVPVNIDHVSSPLVWIRSNQHRVYL